MFVPEKPKTKSLLRADAGTSTPTAVRGGSSLNVLIDPESGEPVAASDTSVPTTAIQGGEGPARISRSIPTERDADVEAMRQEVSSRIRRIRTVPKPPSPAEQKESLESSISSIQEIMSREDEGIDDEMRQKENEAWMKLLQSLQDQKQSIEETAEGADKNESVSSDPEGEGEGQPEVEIQPEGEGQPEVEIQPEGEGQPEDEIQPEGEVQPEADIQTSDNNEE